MCWIISPNSELAHVGVHLGLETRGAPPAVRRKQSMAQRTYSSCSALRSGSPSLSAASSIWMIAAPACSRSTTSSWIASAICVHVSRRRLVVADE